MVFVHQIIFVYTHGDEISIFLTDEFLFGNTDYKIIYEDENILIVNKPVGISVVEDDDSFCLTSVLQKKYRQNNNLSSQASQSVVFPYPCHRIDRNTSGLVLFAKNKQALDILFEKFKNKEIEKHYYCVVLRNTYSKRADFKSIFKKRF